MGRMGENLKKEKNEKELGRTDGRFGISRSNSPYPQFSRLSWTLIAVRKKGRKGSQNFCCRTLPTQPDPYSPILPALPACIFGHIIV